MCAVSVCGVGPHTLTHTHTLSLSHTHTLSLSHTHTHTLTGSHHVRLAAATVQLLLLRLRLHVHSPLAKWSWDEPGRQQNCPVTAARRPLRRDTSLNMLRGRSGHTAPLLPPLSSTPHDLSVCPQNLYVLSARGHSTWTHPCYVTGCEHGHVEQICKQDVTWYQHCLKKST